MVEYIDTGAAALDRAFDKEWQGVRDDILITAMSSCRAERAVLSHVAPDDGAKPVSGCMIRPTTSHHRPCEQRQATNSHGPDQSAIGQGQGHRGPLVERVTPKGAPAM